MENTTGPIKPFIAGKLPKAKYSDVNEFAADLAAILAIEQERIVIDLISLPDIKGDKGGKGDRGSPGSKGEKGDTGATGAAGATGAGLAFVTLVDAATVTWAANTTAIRQNAVVTITSNVTLDLTGWTSGMHGTLKIIQGVGAPWTATLPANSLVAGGGAGAVALSAVAAEIDVLEVFYDGTDFFWKSSLNYT